MSRNERRPGGGTRAATKSIAADILSISPDARHEAPTAEDRLDAEVIAEARARGFRLAARCTACGHWLVAAESVALHLGPVCRARAVAG